MSNPTELPGLEAQLEVALGDMAHAWSHNETEAAKKRIRRLFARCAQPEGEAPQAKPVAWMVPIQGLYEYFATEQAARKEREAYEQEMSDDPDLEHVAPVPLYEHAATLSPLCGAQHAESGKEKHSFTAYVLDCKAAGTVPMTRSDFAAQQAAAPGALAQHCPFCGSTDEVYHGKVTYCDNCGADGPSNERDGQPVAKWSDRAAPSAPGTPEAPKSPFPISDDEIAALRRFWECATDGEGYDVEKSMMQRLAEMGLVQRKSGAYYMSTEFGLYVLGEYTIQRAVQIDGGQEGSESNG